MYRIGLDLSINSTGIVILDENLKTFERWIVMSSSSASKKIRALTDPRINIVIYEKLPTNGDTYAEKEYNKTINIHRAACEIDQILSPYKYSTGEAFIEGISYGSVGSAALADLAGLNFVVRCNLIKQHIPFTIVSPMANKKNACGIGNANKDVMIAAWQKCEPETVGLEKLLKVDDIADAYFLARTPVNL